MAAGGASPFGRITRRARDAEPPAGIVVAAAAVAVAVVLPLTGLIVRVAGVDPGRVIDLLASDTTVDVLANSVALVAAVTAACVAVGVPLAVLTARTDLPFRRFWTVVAALPLVVPSYVGAFAFVSAFGPRGDLAGALAPLGVERVPSIYGLPGTVLVLTLYTYPYVFLTTRASLLSFDGRQVEAARTLDHSRLEAFRRVTLPQIAPGIGAGALLSALYALSDFGTPAIMRYDVFTRVIYVEYTAFGREYAALLSLVLLGVTGVVLAVEARAGDAEMSYASRGPRRAGSICLGAWTGPALAFVAGVAALSLAVPVGVLFAGGAGTEYAVTDAVRLLEAAWHSVYVAVLAAVAATAVALPVAYLSGRYPSRFSTLADRATYVGYAVPGIVLGLAMLSFAIAYLPGLYRTIPILVAAYVIRFLPQAVGSVRASVDQIDGRLVEVARTLDHSRRAAFRRVTLPLIAPGIAAGAALVFLTTMRELPATLVLSPAGFDTLVVYVWRAQEAGDYSQAAVPALALVCVSALSMAVILAREGYRVGR